MQFGCFIWNFLTFSHIFRLNNFLFLADNFSFFFFISPPLFWTEYRVDCLLAIMFLMKSRRGSSRAGCSPLKQCSSSRSLASPRFRLRRRWSPSGPSTTRSRPCRSPSSSPPPSPPCSWGSRSQRWLANRWELSCCRKALFSSHSLPVLCSNPCP